MKLSCIVKIECDQKTAEKMEEAIENDLPALEFYRTSRTFSRPPKFTYKIIVDQPSDLIDIGVKIGQHLPAANKKQ